jgi:hypothetical protein
VSEPESALDVALESHDPVKLRTALGQATVAVLATTVPNDGVGEDVRVRIATGPDGRRSLIVFTGRDAARAFDGGGSAMVRPGRELVGMARYQGVDSVVFNPAGPSGTATIATAALEQIMDGFDAPATVGGAGVIGQLAVLPATWDPAPFALRLAALAPLEAYAFDRLGGAEPIPSLGIVGADAVLERVVEILSSGHELRVIDVLQLNRQTADEVAAALPDARLRI